MPPGPRPTPGPPPPVDRPKRHRHLTTHPDLQTIQAGNTALHRAAENGSPYVIKMLLRHHVDINAKNWWVGWSESVGCLQATTPPRRVGLRWAVS